jgi:hypothetical protein
MILKKIRTWIAAGLVIPAALFAADVFTLVTNCVINPSAMTLPDATFGKQINIMAYQQDALISHNGWQYAAYYNADHFVCVSRRKLPSGSWEHAVLNDYTQSTVDSHNVVSMGICPNDGTIHLAFDHHVSTLHYRISQAGIATDPESAAWSSSLFGPVTNALVAGVPVTQLTYPFFEPTPEGNLQFFFRRDYPTNGDRLIADYNAGSGIWSTPRIFISRAGGFTDSYGTTASRSGYLNPVRYGPDGTLHVTWTWREPGAEGSPGSGDNHDLMYMYSTDRGATWKTTGGSNITGAARVDTPGITAESIPRGYGHINSNAQTIDPQGRVHAVVRHCTDESLAAAGSYPGEITFGPVAARRNHHYWRDFDGTWHHNEIPGAPGQRTCVLFADDPGNLYLARDNGPGLEILHASFWSQWTNWTVVYTAPADIYSEILFDSQRWQSERVLSVIYQETPPVTGAPSALRSMDLKCNAGQPVAPAMYRHKIAATADVYVRSDHTQDGTGEKLYVKNVPTSGYLRKTFLRFPLQKPASPFFSATLRLFAGTVSGPVNVSVYAIDDDSWTESGVTWSNAPPFNKKLCTTAVTTNNIWVEWNITEAVAANSAEDRFLSLALWIDTPTSADTIFRSREYNSGELAPELTVWSASAYTDWANGHGVNEFQLDPDGDTNHDGVPNLIAFATGAASPLTTVESPLIDLTIEGAALRASSRRAGEAKAFGPFIDQRDSLTTGIWNRVSTQIETNYYGAGHDRLSFLATNPASFFRMRGIHLKQVVAMGRICVVRSNTTCCRSLR